MLRGCIYASHIGRHCRRYVRLRKQKVGHSCRVAPSHDTTLLFTRRPGTGAFSTKACAILVLSIPFVRPLPALFQLSARSICSMNLRVHPLPLANSGLRRCNDIKRRLHCAAYIGRQYASYICEPAHPTHYACVPCHAHSLRRRPMAQLPADRSRDPGKHGRADTPQSPADGKDAGRHPCFL